MRAETRYQPGVTDALALPTLDGLDEDRAAGRACVWSGTSLTIETAVDLGQQRGARGAWFPRACPTCVARRAYHALTAHAPSCPDCRSEERPDCPLGAGLRGLVAVHAPVRYCSACARQIAPGEPYETHPSQSPSGAGGATPYTHRVCPRGRRR